VSVEERLRATTEAVTAAMRPVRPLDLPANLSDARPAAKPDRARLPRRWPGRLVPVAAAAAVIAVAATPVAVRNLSGAGADRPVTPAATSTTLPSGVPRYYVALTDISTSKEGALVRNAFLGDAGTGKRLATFKPPSDVMFTGVAAAADDKTFVLDAVVGPDVGTSGSRAKASGSLVETSPSLVETSPSPVEMSGSPARLSLSAPRSHIFYVLRLTPGAAHQAQLSRIPMASSFTDAATWGLAVSPDGRTLAIGFQAGVNDAAHKTPIGPLTLRTYSLATGQALHTWTEPTTRSFPYSVIDPDNSVRLSWLDDGHTLAFNDGPLSTHQVIRTLDTNRPGTQLIAGSEPVFTVPGGCYAPLVTSDGQAVICGTLVEKHGCVNGVPELTAYSVATGKLERVLYRGGCSLVPPQAEWAESGTLAIGDILISKAVNPLQPVTNTIGVTTPGKFTSLPVTLKGGSYNSPGAIAF
jgi:hypothetical protein